MTALIAMGLGWVLLSLPVGVLLGRGIRVADDAVEAPFRTDGVEAYLREQAAARQA